MRVPKSNHAGESALAVGPILAQALAGNEPLTRAALTAIARHHAPFGGNAAPYTLEARAEIEIQSTLEWLPKEVREGINISRLKVRVAQKQAIAVVGPDDPYGWPAYTLLARALRRADQEGTARGSR